MPTEFLESDDEGTSENPPTKDLKTDKAVQEPEKKENVSGEKINEEKKEETKSSSLKSQKNEEDFGQMNLLDFQHISRNHPRNRRQKAMRQKQQKGPERLIKKRIGKRALLFPGIQKILKR